MLKFNDLISFPSPHSVVVKTSSKNFFSSFEMDEKSILIFFFQKVIHKCLDQNNLSLKIQRENCLVLIKQFYVLPNSISNIVHIFFFKYKF